MVRRGLRNSAAIWVTAPAGEGPDKQADHGGDRRPAVRRERAEVRGVGGRGGQGDHSDHQHQQGCGESELHAAGDPHAETVGEERRHEDRQRNHSDPAPVGAEQGDDVFGAEHTDDRGADAHAEVEPVAGGARGGGAQGTAHEGGDSPGVRIARSECGEGAGQRHRQQQHRGNADQRSGSGSARGERGQHEDSAAENGRDVEGRRAEHAEAGCFRGGESGGHASTMPAAGTRHPSRSCHVGDPSCQSPVG